MTPNKKSDSLCRLFVEAKTFPFRTELLGILVVSVCATPSLVKVKVEDV